MSTPMVDPLGVKKRHSPGTSTPLGGSRGCGSWVVRGEGERLGAAGAGWSEGRARNAYGTLAVTGVNLRVAGGPKPREGDRALFVGPGWRAHGNQYKGCGNTICLMGGMGD